ncbi:DUF4142 domain-containing protein [Chelativorans sp. YIM 93263]|uniref:DUF4142 domain-containing protein n=1 Tax=Chelativorans sp. YIM 93263 TaxID=2906648 RepID=UPI002379ECF9|nr:DUF4142 domain-containing protein [Chelativorans sp. YIM 93263]
MKRSFLLVTAALAFVLAGPAISQEAAPEASGSGAAQIEIPSTPQEFAMMAAQSNMFEIESSRVALEKAQQDAVREFAQRMVDDHTMASQQMMQAAQADAVTDVPQTLDARHQEMLTQLQNAAPEQFDSQYLQMQLAAHQEAVALFEGYAQQEGALADFAETTVPTLQEHLSMVQDLAQ